MIIVAERASKQQLSCTYGVRAGAKLELALNKTVRVLLALQHQKCFLKLNSNVN